MASLSGPSSGSSTVTQISVLSEDLQMGERKRRSRVRKKKHLDELTAQVTQLRNENRQIITRVNIIVQHYLNVEAENSVLRAQAKELSRGLQCSEEMISFLNGEENMFKASSVQHLGLLGFNYRINNI
ncbi:pentatricopeptide repeat-containing protein [Hibiscus syriacus]|uniref:Pentatricopeptide repeat-containing protein n=1 Tax=Hibiscus syriacus TaxID=106335 RepID=A0A6A3A3P9_HIBSY|nr:bZIP transcription factor 11-like [Hibiscus syriacus]KAE8698663.1 pentatricopeptide repeat-containing protein [Hibiscus syriacus]